MKITFFSIVTLLATTLAASAQGPFGPPGGLPPNPLLEALDTDSDQQISLSELTGGKEAFASLDKDNDGKLSREELRPEMGRRGGPGPGGFGGPGGPGGHDGPGFGFGGERRPGRGQASGGSRAARNPLQVWLTLDKNNDGQLEKSEVGNRMQALIERADADKDGVATKAELEALAKQELSSGQGTARGGRGFPRSGARDEVRDGEGPRRGFGRGGPPSAEMFVTRALTFDKNKDGQLSEDELKAMATEMMSRRGPEGFAGGPGRGGRGRQGGATRPARPE